MERRWTNPSNKYKRIMKQQEQWEPCSKGVPLKEVASTTESPQEEVHLAKDSKCHNNSKAKEIYNKQANKLDTKVDNKNQSSPFEAEAGAEARPLEEEETPPIDSHTEKDPHQWGGGEEYPNSYFSGKRSQLTVGY